MNTAPDSKILAHRPGVESGSSDETVNRINKQNKIKYFSLIYLINAFQLILAYGKSTGKPLDYQFCPTMNADDKECATQVYRTPHLP